MPLAYLVAEHSLLFPVEKLIMRVLLVPNQYLVVDSTGQGETERQKWLPHDSVRIKDSKCLSSFLGERILIKYYGY